MSNSNQFSTARSPQLPLGSILSRIATLFLTNTESTTLPPPILVNSIPKSGTNLLLNMVRSIPGTTLTGDVSLTLARCGPGHQLGYLKQVIKRPRPGNVFAGHVPYSARTADWLRSHSIRQVFICRDPRDYTVSLYHYIMREAIPRHAYYEMFSRLGSDANRLMGAIRGLGVGQARMEVSPVSMANVKLMYDAFEGWRHNPNTLAMKYEDLVAPTGRPRSESRSVVTRLLRHLGLQPDTSLVDRLLTQGMDPSVSRTFRKGGSGHWREEYTPSHLNAFSEVAGDLLSKWGYATGEPNGPQLSRPAESPAVDCGL